MKRAGNRGGSSKKAAPITASNEEDTSYIIFGDGKAAKKTRKPVQGEVIDGVSVEDAQKKPDTRKLIGGASWTGKLPVNMLSEHCQKQKWAKPEYTMVCLV